MYYITEYQDVKHCDTKSAGRLSIRQNLQRRFHLFRSEIGIFEIFFKGLYKEGFEDLQ